MPGDRSSHRGLVVFHPQLDDLIERRAPRATRRVRPSSWRSTYGSALVAVSSPPQTPDGRYVDVPTFDSLVQLAETYEKLILHHQQAGVHSFYIDDDSSVYRYTLDRASQGPEAQPTEVV